MAAVLIVDDSAADRFLLKTILARAGFEVHEVDGGRRALAKAREVRPHMIILDVNLPDMSGLDVCRSIRADHDLATVPVLMLTVRHDDKDVVHGLQAGADDYVVKDAPGEIIVGRVTRLIEFRQMAGMAMLNQQLAQIGRLLAGIVHEIRGPLSVIRGNAELLRFTIPPDDPNFQWLESILRNTHLLQHRMDHLMAAVRNRSASVEATDVCGVLQETTELFSKGFRPTGRRIEVDTSGIVPVPLVHVDSGRLMQVLLNLLNNAVEAINRSSTGNRIRVTTAVAEDEGNPWVQIKVSDNGPGIPPALIDRIFEPFFTTRQEGSGYGLYLASEIVKEQSGRLIAENNAEGGATFTIGLPTSGSEPYQDSATTAALA
jgi:signal transduction histidine kinase